MYGVFVGGRHVRLDQATGRAGAALDFPLQSLVHFLLGTGAGQVGQPGDVLAGLLDLVPVDAAAGGAGVLLPAPAAGRRVVDDDLAGRRPERFVPAPLLVEGKAAEGRLGTPGRRVP